MPKNPGIQLKIMSESDAIRYIQKSRLPLAVISITGKGERDAEIPQKENMKYLLRLKFNDFEDAGPDGHYAGVLPSASDIKGLKKWVDDVFQNQDIRILAVHCAGGISRSAGMGQAISDYKGLGYHAWANIHHHPNRLVYKLTCEELGVDTRETDIREIFGKFSLPCKEYGKQGFISADDIASILGISYLPGPGEEDTAEKTRWRKAALVIAKQYGYVALSVQKGHVFTVEGCMGGRRNVVDGDYIYLDHRGIAGKDEEYCAIRVQATHKTGAWEILTKKPHSSFDIFEYGKGDGEAACTGKGIVMDSRDIVVLYPFW